MNQRTKELCVRLRASGPSCRHEAADLIEELMPEHEKLMQLLATGESTLERLRKKGWAVGCHNDYRQGGEKRTFWLLTNGDRCVTGEGRSDWLALAGVEIRIAALEAAGRESRLTPRSRCYSRGSVLL